MLLALFCGFFVNLIKKSLTFRLWPDGILRFIEVGTSGQHHAVAAGQRYQTAGGRTPGNPVFALLYPVCDRISIPAFQPAKRLYASRFRDGFVCVRTHGDGQRTCAAAPDTRLLHEGFFDDGRSLNVGFSILAAANQKTVLCDVRDGEYRRPVVRAALHYTVASLTLISVKDISSNLIPSSVNRSIAAVIEVL